VERGGSQQEVKVRNQFTPPPEMRADRGVDHQPRDCRQRAREEPGCTAPTASSARFWPLFSSSYSSGCWAFSRMTNDALRTGLWSDVGRL
jgi:hypothetical protein